MKTSKKSKKIVIAGVMTGTSCDGLDVAAIEFDGKSWSPLWEASAEYPQALRKKVIAVQDPEYLGSLKSTFALHRDLGFWYGQVLKNAFEQIKPALRPDVISNHGQTVGHFPLDKNGGYTIQLGDPAQISSITGLTVVSHFRNGDIAMGGQGAPLAPIFHRLIAGFLPNREDGIAIHNLGGISNFTYLSPRGQIEACDTGPANVFIDAAVEIVTKGKKHFDDGGKLASEGEVDVRALSRLLKHPFFKKPLPKSTGRDDFTFGWFVKETKGVARENLVATATALTVESIARTYESFLKSKRSLGSVYFTGGGTQNPVLMSWLSQRLCAFEVKTLDDLGFNSQFIEAQAFAYLGFLSLRGETLGGNWTGAKKFASPGWITPGKNWNEVLKRLP